MAPTNPRPQATFFYTDDWTPAIDGWFIEKLAVWSVENHTTVTWRDWSAIRFAQNEVNELFDTGYSYRHCLMQFHKLKERYDVFSFITSLNGVYFDETNNKVRVLEDYIWDYVTLKHSIGEAYMLQGEPAWESLRTIFGTPEHDNTPRAPEFIDLTHSTSVDSNQSSPPPVTWPRHTFDIHANKPTSSFWEDLTQFGYENVSSPSVTQRAASHSSDDSLSYAKPPLIPRSLWPKPGSVLYVDSPRPKAAAKAKAKDDDRNSSTASSSSLPFDPFRFTKADY